MKAERVQFRYDLLEGWVLITSTQRSRKAKPTGIWTALEMADHLEACELVPLIGKIADQHCVQPEVDVRRNYVFITAGNPKDGLSEADFDFAEAIDREIGPGLKAKSLVGHEGRKLPVA